MHVIVWVSLLLGVGAVCAGGDIGDPDPYQSDVLPMDGMLHGRLNGSFTLTRQGLADIDVTLRDAEGYECVGADAMLENDDDCCYSICSCEDHHLTVSDVSDESGHVDFWFRRGGYCDLAGTEEEAWIKARADQYSTWVWIRVYPLIVGHSRWGYRCDRCSAPLADFVDFGSHWTEPGDALHTDYDGSGLCGLEDFISFASDWLAVPCDNYNPTWPPDDMCSWDD